MRRFTPMAMILGVFVLAACAEQEPAEEMESAEMPAAEAPETPALSLADFEGTWNATAYMESGDTVPYTLTATADADGWMVELPDRDPMPLRIVALEGDSLVAEMGPYESLLREGVMVTVRTVNRLEDGAMVGTMEARYEGADSAAVVAGRVEATRGM